MAVFAEVDVAFAAAVIEEVSALEEATVVADSAVDVAAIAQILVRPLK